MRNEQLRPRRNVKPAEIAWAEFIREYRALETQWRRALARDDPPYHHLTAVGRRAPRHAPRDAA